MDVMLSFLEILVKATCVAARLTAERTVRGQSVLRLIDVQDYGTLIDTERYVPSMGVETLFAVTVLA
jgi:hypothetical protein